MSVNCEACQNLFQSGVIGAELQSQVDQQFPGFQCEQCQISPHSPGPVANDEDVIFLTIHPIHFDPESNTLAPVAFQQLTRNDLSLLRKNHCADDLPQTVLKLQEIGAGPREIELCCVLPAGEIRGEADGDGRIFGVYDTALPDIRSHASVFVRRDFLADGSSRRRARIIAHRIFKERLMRLRDL